jgi:hypothetical protein
MLVNWNGGMIFLKEELGVVNSVVKREEDECRERVLVVYVCRGVEEEVMFFEREYEQWKRRDKERGMREEDVFS